MPPAIAGTLKSVPTQALTDGSVAGTWSSSTSAGRTISGSISSTYESKANPIAAVMQMVHCSGVRRGAGLSICAFVIRCTESGLTARVAPKASEKIRRT